MILPYGRPRLIEIADQPWCPESFRQAVQNILTFLWIQRIWPFQALAPYEIAAGVLEKVLKDIETDDDLAESRGTREVGERLRIVDFCSGAGGPMPAIEQRLNYNRKKSSKVPVPVQMTDLHPNPGWAKRVSPGSPLSFIPHPVNALNIPPELAKHRHLRTFCLAFHHFGEKAARRILEDAMRHSEGICIFEMQEPTPGSIFTILLLFPLSLLVTPFVRPSPSVLFWTYIIPIIPFIIVFDGIVSAWRTRSPAHISHLANLAQMSVNMEIVEKPYTDTPKLGSSENGNVNGDGQGQVERREEVEWRWESGRKRHTWPFGDMVWVVGRRDNRAEDEVGGLLQE